MAEMGGSVSSRLDRWYSGSAAFEVQIGLHRMGIAPGVVRLMTWPPHFPAHVDKIGLDQPVASDYNPIHLGNGQTGTHALRLPVGDHVHMPHGPPVMSKKITSMSASSAVNASIDLTLSRLLAGLLLMIFAAFAWPQTAAAQGSTPRVALVIGNGAYAQAPIEDAVEGARLVADVLRRGGFTVIYLENAQRDEIQQGLAKFAKSLERGGHAIIFYDGHAVQYQGRNYLVAMDSKITGAEDVRREAVDVDLLLDPLIVARPAGSVLILDASRANPWQALLPGGRRGLAEPEPVKSVTVVFSTAPDRVVASGARASGVFAEWFAQSMKTPDASINEVINRTRTAVAQINGKDQRVWQSQQAPTDLVVTSASRPSAKPASGIETAPAESPVTAAPQSPALPIRDCPTCPELALIPAGTLTMGATDEFVFETPVHEVTIPKAFFMGRREVTFDEWDACVSDGGCEYRPGDRGQGRGLRPVSDLAWTDTKPFVAWLSRKTGKTYRLPTEAEWEYAARAGTKTSFYWGNAIEKDRANCAGCNTQPRNQTVAAGTFPPNAFGLFDMAGNAAEWVEDCWEDSYKAAPTDGSALIRPDCRERVLRGGSFNNDQRFVRSAARFKYDFDVRYYTNGFRVVRER
jgi:formylglycine-generating enzyme required for sulfatase activity